uniref:Uncharacterized protein n=1 Tax=Arundo donax TaxID=35708 RepID=A0A0A9BF23_ARUDO
MQITLYGSTWCINQSKILAFPSDGDKILAREQLRSRNMLINHTNNSHKSSHQMVTL